MGFEASSLIPLPIYTCCCWPVCTASGHLGRILSNFFLSNFLCAALCVSIYVFMNLLGNIILMKINATFIIFSTQATVHSCGFMNIVVVRLFSQEKDEL
jgi:hypothetical protein